MLLSDHLPQPQVSGNCTMHGYSLSTDSLDITTAGGNSNPKYSPNQPYNGITRSQPHVLLLEPADFDRDSGALLLETRPFALPTEEFGNPRFINSIASQKVQPLSQSIHKYDWAYTLRHDAQPILPFLYLGPASTVRNPEFLRAAGITMVIAVRNGQAARRQPKLLDPARFPSCANLQTATFDVDSPYEVITKIRPVLKSMVDHLEQMTGVQQVDGLEDVKGRILVFCESGNERSPALVAAFLMLIYGLNWQDAVNLIHIHRFSTCLNTSMNDMLRTWQDILKARSDTALAQGSQPSASDSEVLSHIRNTKRTIDDIRDSDDDMDVDSNVEIRPGIAPFKDMQI